jgi:hypothetical protein
MNTMFPARVQTDTGAPHFSKLVLNGSTRMISRSMAFFKVASDDQFDNLGADVPYCADIDRSRESESKLVEPAAGFGALMGDRSLAFNGALGDRGLLDPFGALGSHGSLIMHGSLG